MRHRSSVVVAGAAGLGLCVFAVALVPSGAAAGFADARADVVWGQGGNFSTSVGGRSASSLRLNALMDTDASGNLYVADSSNRRVLRFPKGSLEADRVWGLSNMTDFSTEGSFQNAYDVSVDALGGVYISDVNGGVTAGVQYFAAGSVDGTLPDRQYGPILCGGACASLASVISIDVDSTGLYVCDFLKHRVLFFPGENSTHPTRVYGQANFSATLANRGSSTPSADTLSSPYNVRVVPGGVMVADLANHRVLFYPGNSTVATIVWGQDGDFSSNIENKGGMSGNSLRFPYGIAVDRERGAYISDNGNNRVLYFSSWGNTSASKVFGQLGNFSSGSSATPSAFSLDGPWGVLVDEDVGLYISDYRNNRVLLFENVTGVAATTGISTGLSTGDAIATTTTAATVTAAATTAAGAAGNTATIGGSASTDASTTTASTPVPAAESSTASQGDLLVLVLAIVGGIIVALLLCFGLAFLVYRKQTQVPSRESFAMGEMGGGSSSSESDLASTSSESKKSADGGVYHNRPTVEKDRGSVTYHNNVSASVQEGMASAADAGTYHNKVSEGVKEGIRNSATDNAAGAGTYHNKVSEGIRNSVAVSTADAGTYHNNVSEGVSEGIRNNIAGSASGNGTYQTTTEFRSSNPDSASTSSVSETSG